MELKPVLLSVGALSVLLKTDLIFLSDDLPKILYVCF